MVEDWEEKYKRARADYVNLERRVKASQGEVVRFANIILLCKLLPIADDLERAVASSSSDDHGTRLILKNLQSVLSSEGVEEIPVGVGDAFDPQVMEGIVSDSFGERLKVAEVIKKGYRIDKRVLRTAQVRVRREEEYVKDNRN